MTIPPIYFLLSSCLVSCLYLLMLDTSPIIPPSRKSAPRAPPKKEHPTDPTIAYPRPLNIQPAGDFAAALSVSFFTSSFSSPKSFLILSFTSSQLRFPIIHFLSFFFLFYF